MLQLTNMLPKAILEAWSCEAYVKLGGWLELAGVDPDSVFRSRSITDHPWIGLTVTFPFPEVGRGRITRCVIHPRGKLMFDVEFPNPVPPIHGKAVVLVDNPSYHQTIHRFFGYELLEITRIVQ